MPDVKIPVLQRGFYADTGRWVKGKHFIQKVESIGISLVEQTLEGDFVSIGEIADIFLGTRGTYPGECLLVGSSKVV